MAPPLDPQLQAELQAQLDGFLQESAAYAAFYQKAARFVALQSLLKAQEPPQPRRRWRRISPARFLSFLRGRRARRVRHPLTQTTAPVIIEATVTKATSAPIIDADEPSATVIVINVD
jgi:hypothetical protein